MYLSSQMSCQIVLHKTQWLTVWDEMVSTIAQNCTTNTYLPRWDSKLLQNIRRAKYYHWGSFHRPLSFLFLQTASAMDPEKRFPARNFSVGIFQTFVPTHFSILNGLLFKVYSLILFRTFYYHFLETLCDKNVAKYFIFGSEK